LHSFIITIYVSQWGRAACNFPMRISSAALKGDLMRAHAEIYANGKQPAHYRVHAQMAKKVCSGLKMRAHARKFNRLENASFPLLLQRSIDRINHTFFPIKI
jgi:hypothetical protein